MGSLQTFLPFKLAATDEALTAHGGLALVGEYVRAMGICSLMIMNCPAPAVRRVIILPLMSCRWF